MYRDDLEAAQARADALEREARTQKDRADDAQREAAELRAKNDELETAARVKTEVRALVAMREGSGKPELAAARMRRSIIGWSLAGVGTVTMVLAGNLALGTTALAIGAAVLVIGLVLA